MTTSTFSIPKLLIVDDVPANLVAIEACLGHLDVEIIRASSGHEALSLVLKHDLALVLLDVQMPEMDGFETASLIRTNKETDSLPIIFVTAISKDDQHVCTGYGLGAVDYLFKPLNPDILQAKVRVFLDRYHHLCEREATQAALAEYTVALERSNEDLEQLAFVVSHDLQEPLRKVTSFCQMLQESCGDKLDEDELSYIELVVDGAARMKQLISDLLELSRIGTRSQKPSPTALQDALNDALANLEFAIKGAEGIVTHDEMPTVLAGHRRLVQLLQNLIGNALKYQYADRRPEIHIGVQHDSDQWLISVRDNGIGIGDEHYQRIFKVFQRLHARNRYSGTGIGLAICKKIVNRFGGRIWVESLPDQGSTFYFTLPQVPGITQDSMDNREDLICSETC